VMPLMTSYFQFPGSVHAGYLAPRVSATSRIKSQLNTNADRRKIADRRTREEQWRHDRRVCPDRRLSNISVELIPFSEVALRPDIRDSLCIRKKSNQSRGTKRCEPLSTGPFENQWSPPVDRRIVTDRRVRQEKHPYNRRVRPDRRLNNIFMEWIPYK
jgi:hypothetical protein